MFDKDSALGSGDDAARPDTESRLRLREVIARATGEPPTVTKARYASPRSDEDSFPPSTGQDEQAEGGAESEQRVATNSGGGRLIRRWVPDGIAAGMPRRGQGRLRGLAVTACVLTVLLAGGYVLFSGPNEQHTGAASKLPVAHMSSSVAPTTTSSRSDPVVVSIVGHVADPGVLTLSPDARVADALDAAGGAKEPADRRSVNLARRVVDGEQVYVGVSAPATATQPASAGESAGTGENTVNLNAADLTTLQELPSVGEVTAQRIIDWRDEHDGFEDVEQLQQIGGIGSKTLADLRDRVSIE